MSPIPPELLGPAGLLVALLLAVAALWRDHLRADADDRTQRDKAMAIAEAIVPALRNLTGALEADTRDRTTRHRVDDR